MKFHKLTGCLPAWDVPVYGTVCVLCVEEQRRNRNSMLILERLGLMHSPGIKGVDLDSKAMVQGGQGQTFGIIKKNLWKRGGRLRNPAIQSHHLAYFFHLSQA